MAPRKEATVLCAAEFCSSLCVNCVSGHSSGFSYTREELLNYRTTTPVDLFPVFVASAADLLHILIRRVRRRKRGKRAGVLVRLRRRGLRTPLPGIFLSNVRSLRNKMDELRLMRSMNRDFSSSCVLCFVESWLCEDIPDSALQLEGFHLFRADRQVALTGKATGGGVCFYINTGWCTDTTVLSQHCSPSLEYLFIHCKPFYSPREFASFILAAVYIPPDADVQEAQCVLAEQILSVERTYPDSLIIALGDFNKANLSHELPKYKQYIKCPTREERTLDHCYSTISGAYHAVPRAALGLSDHDTIHLIPAYRQRLKLFKPVVRTTRRWTSEAVEELRTCFETTDWDSMRAASDSLDEYADAVTSYVHFCEDSIVPTRTRVSYNNDKPWFTPKLKQLWIEKREAFKSGDRDLYREAKYRFSREVDTARSQHSENMRQQISENDTASVWRSLRQITNYQPRTPHSTDDLQTANRLNDFYCRFDDQSSSPHTSHTSSPGLDTLPPTSPAPHTPEPTSRTAFPHAPVEPPSSPHTSMELHPSSSLTSEELPPSSPHTSQELPPSPSHTPEKPANPPPPSSPLCIKEEEVLKQFKRLSTRKAPGPDGVSPATLRHCAEELAPVFTDIFNSSLEACHVPDCYKTSTIVPVPKKPRITGLNDYRPVALTSVVMKSFERLVLSYLKSLTDPLLDPLQFAYRANRSVDDAINLALHYILRHLDSPGTYARILFVDFSSAFNTILPDLLQGKLSQMNVPDPICRWVTDFLKDRKQHVRLGKNVSDSRTISTGSPQGCVLSPLLFSLYTNCCTSDHQSVKLIKFADDTTLIGLISDGDESAYRLEVERLVSWCSHNNLVLNAQKTVEIIVDFRKHTAPLPSIILTDSPITTVDSFRFLGTTITQDLKWEPTITSVIKKAQQRMYFLRQLKKFKLPAKTMVQFYTAMIESILTSSITVWYAGATTRDKQRLQRVVRSAEKVIGCSLPSIQDLYISRTLGRAGRITADPSHPGHGLFDPLPSGRRLRSIRTRTSRHKNSFFPSAVGLMNNSNTVPPALSKRP